MSHLYLRDNSVSDIPDDSSPVILGPNCRFISKVNSIPEAVNGYHTLKPLTSYFGFSRYFNALKICPSRKSIVMASAHLFVVFL